jgi:hypothetical protein
MFFISKKFDILVMGDEAIAVTDEFNYLMNPFYGLLGPSLIMFLFSIILKNLYSKIDINPIN